MRVLHDTHFDFLKYRRFWVSLSVLLVALGLGVIFTGQLRLGIDFAGGTQLTVRFRDEPDLERIRGLLADAGEQASIQRFRDERNEVLITLPLDARGIEGRGSRIVEILERGLEGAATDGRVFDVVKQDSVGPQIGAELRLKGFLAVSLSLAGMLAYIALRFRLPFGVGAVAASLHDVMVTLGLYALAGFDFDLNSIAALLTLVGYSVNDTVVVFDRVRENRRANPRKPLYEVMNRSLNDTLSRTVLTSGTTLLVTASLLAFGGQALRGFSFALTVGVVVGTYSTIYVASPIALYLEEHAERRAAGGHHEDNRHGRPRASGSVPASS